MFKGVFIVNFEHVIAGWVQQNEANKLAQVLLLTLNTSSILI